MNIPSDVFVVPSEADLEQNPTYWTGYRLGAAASRMLTFPSTGVKVYGDWRQILQGYLVTAAANDNAGVGFNAAILDAGLYLWLNDPESPHKNPEKAN